MILLNHVQLTDFLSHEKTNLPFKENFSCIINGKSGAGKSSIVEALTWGLYGEGRSDNRSLIRRGTDKASVSVTLKDTESGTLYKVTRSINTKGKHNLTVEEQSNGGEFTPIPVTGIKEVQAHLERKILRSSYALYTNSIYYPQENKDNFVNQTAARRKDIILEIARASDYDEYDATCFEALSERKRNKAVTDSGIEYRKSIVSEKESINAIVSEASGESEAFKKKLSEVDVQLEVIQKGIREQESIKASIDHTQNDLANAQVTAGSLLASMEKNEHDQKQLESLDVATVALYVSELKAYREKIKVLEQQRELLYQWSSKATTLKSNAPSLEVTGRIERQLAAIDLKIKELEATPIAVCQPETGKKCPLIQHRVHEEIEKQKTERTSLQQELDGQKKRIEEHQKALDALGPMPIFDEGGFLTIRKTIETLEPYEKQLAEIELKQSKLEELKVNYTVLKEQHAAVILQMSSQSESLTKLRESYKLPQLESDERRLKGERVITQAAYDQNAGRLSVAQEKQKNIAAAEKELASMVKEIETLSHDIECLELLRGAFGQNGIRAMVVDHIIPELEDRINAILGKLSDFRVRLDTQKSSISGDSVLEGLFISIFNDRGEEFALENYSGGEKLKITVAIAEGLAEIQSAGFRILDETFIGLDEDSTESFMGVISTLQKRFNQLICISHLRTIKDMFQDTVTVVKNQGISTIV